MSPDLKGMHAASDTAPAAHTRPPKFNKNNHAWIIGWRNLKYQDRESCTREPKSRGLWELVHDCLVEPTRRWIQRILEHFDVLGVSLGRSGQILNRGRGKLVRQSKTLEEQKTNGKFDFVCSQMFTMLVNEWSLKWVTSFFLWPWWLPSGN